VEEDTLAMILVADHGLIKLQRWLMSSSNLALAFSHTL